MKHHVLNRGISLLLILVMAASMLSFAAGAEGETSAEERAGKEGESDAEIYKEICVR